MPRIPDKCRLLHGPYHSPPFKRGDRVDCLLRGTVKITSWTSARTSWPRCLPVQSKCHPSLLLDDELARAARTEALAAVCFWWGVSHGVIQRWRRFLDVTRTNNRGTHRLVQASAEAGAKAIKAKEWTDEERDAARERAKRLNLGRNLHRGYYGPRWTAAQRKLLGKFPDEEIARRTGRTTNAVRIKRTKAGLPTAKDKRRR